MRIIQIYKADLLNGVGLRNVYFFSFCEHRCPGCFSPETWEKMTPGSRPWTSDDFEKMIQDASQPWISGITLSGGDPLSRENYPEILELCREFKAKLPEKTIWVYTGYSWEKVCEREILKYIDVLCDGPFIKDLKSPSKPWVGSSNQRVIDVKKSLRLGKPEILIGSE